MPFKVTKRGGGYKVCKPSGKCYSKKTMSKQQAERQQRAMYANYQPTHKESFDQVVNSLLKEFMNTGGPAGSTTTAPLGVSSQTPQQQQSLKNINDPAHLQQVCSSVDVNDPQHLNQACAEFGVNPTNPQQAEQVNTIKQGIATYNKKPQATPAQQQQKLTQPINNGVKAPVSAPPNVNNPVSQPAQQI
jgi:hypothetical protein